jgi:7tm Odorant receptor
MDFLEPFQFHKKFLKFTGLWFSSNSKKLKSAALIFHFSVLIFFVIPLWHGVITARNFKERVKFMNILFGEMSCLVKILFLITKHEEIKKLLMEMNKNGYQPMNETEAKLLKNGGRKWTKGTIFLIILFTVGIFSQIASWFGTEKLPNSQWFYGINWQGNIWIYRVIYVYNVAMTLLHPFLHVIFNTLMMFFVNFTSSQMELICHRFSNLKGKLYMTKFKATVKRQQKVNKLHKKILNLFSKILFVQLSISSVITCFFAYQVMMVRLMR